MKKIYTRLFVFAVAFVATLAVLCYNESKDFYDAGENGRYEVSSGETFTFKLRDPGSAMSQIWLNPVPALELVESVFQPDLFEQGCAGCSGTGIYTFKAKKAGTYKILMGLCQPGGERCEKQNIEPDNVFTIIVSP